MTNLEISKDELEGETKNIQEHNNQSQGKSKDVYFLILSQSEAKIDFKNMKFVAGISPTIVYTNNVDKGKGTQLEEIVFKFKRKKKKEDKEEKKSGENEYTIKFISGDHTYKISFDTKNKSFIYSPDFKTGNIYLTNIPEEPIEQDIIPLYNKFDIFLDALEKNGENDKRQKLFEDSINIYEKKKKFSLLTTVFLKIYKNNKVLCENLIKIFNTINEKENKDRDKDLIKYLNDFTNIYSKAQEIVEENKYDPIQFYGVLFCYLHYYDKNNFSKTINKFWEGNADTLYEILIQYYTHFMNPLNQPKEFYDQFIKYILEKKKELKIFERVMDYIEDIESFLYVINKNKEKIFEKYEKLNSEPIKIGANLKLIKYTHDKTQSIKGKNENSDNESEGQNEADTGRIDRLQAIENECDNIIKLIEKLIEFSKKQKALAVYMKSTFWINLIKKYDIPNWENINNLHKLRDIYKKYNNLINLLYEEKTEGDIKSKKNKKNQKFTIKSDINRYYERDEFAHLLNKNIKDFFQKDKEKDKDKDRLTNAEILATVEQFNPYFSVRDKADRERYKNNRETYIFDYINFKKITPYFIEAFQTLNFEIMFEKIISDYISKITGKIEDLQTFGNIMKLIEVDRIKSDKQIEYFGILKEKYKFIVENKIKLIKGETELKESVKIISEFVSKLFLYEKNNGFLDDKIKKLDDKIKSLIYIELITSPAYNDEKYKDQKNHIYDIYLKNIEIKESRENVIKLVNKLKGDEKKFFIEEKLLKKCEFVKEEFFSNQENYKIKTLIDLKKELEEGSQNEGDIVLDLPKISEKGNESAINLMNTIDDIRQDLEKGKITKKDLEKFLKIKRKPNKKGQVIKTKESKEISTDIKEKKDKEQEERKNNEEKERKKNEEEVKEKLGLISLVLNQYSPVTKYPEYKKIIEDINEKVDYLIFIKDSLLIFHKNKFIKDIQKITSIINEIENSPIINFRNEEKKNEINEFTKYDPLCKQISLVKDFLLFKKIFENAQGKDQLERFEDATKKLSSLKTNFEENKSNIEIIFNDKDFKNIFNDIKDELSKKESKSELFISQMIENFDIKNKSVIEDLKMLIKSKKYENIIKSINYFFENFTNKKILLSKNKTGNKNDFDLSGKKLSNLKSILHELKDIYDYKDTNPYYKVFTSIYEKKEAIDFLIKYINTDEKALKKKLKTNLDPTNRSISIKDIDDTIECLAHFKKLINKDTKEIINYIKLLRPEQIRKFESFSKKYGSIIELDSKTGKDKFEKIYEIINDASLLFNLDNENFIYTINGETKIIENIEELIKLKSKINIQPKKNEKDNKSQIEEKEKDPYEIKCDKLLFFKDIISNLEIIYDKINILRIKGFNIPIVINVKLQYPNVSYILNNKEKKFNEIKDYLVKIKNDYENQLSKVYETKKYLRLLYGKLFRKIRQHQEGNFEIFEIKRYILNKTSTSDKIEEAKDINNIAIGEDYEQEYRDNTKDIFESMSNYLIDLFNTNGLNFDKHYEKMKIKKENTKGISLHQCTDKSMEEYILNDVFNEYLGKLPIAQNVLICSKETSIEEMQSFLYRAILCEYNTLFVIEILKSFTNYQHNKMYSYIDKLLSIKLEKFKKNNEDKIDIDKENAKIYLDSYIIFVYQELDNESAFQQELGKYRKEPPTKTVENQSFDNNEKEKEDEEDKKLGDLNISNISKHSISSIHDNKLLDNVKVITSDVCGLGKSFKIKKIIEESKKYYHFPLGGKLSKNVIFKKIDRLFKKIKKEAKKESKSKEDKGSLDKKEEEDFSMFNNIAIHLDLTETKEISLINEFLFSFLITKFYTDNENIIYIPNNIQIYVEVPNSPENYLKKFGILNVFTIENIKLGELLPLELESNIRKKFKQLNGIETNEDIERFIKEKFNEINIKEFSYYQIQTFIKLYISLFDSKDKDIKITKECIDYFVNSSKYFINGGFSKYIMKKIDKNDKKNKDNTDELQTVYESDLSEAEFDDPLIFIDEKTKKFKLEKLPDINKEEDKGKKNSENLKKDVDIVYLIDATGSMDYEINAAKENVISIFENLNKNYKDYDFRFGSVFYRDKIDSKDDKDEYFEFTKDMQDLKEKIGKVKAYGGGDGPEDWVGGYDIALNQMKWRNGIKLIIHIADAGAHGTEFSKNDRHEEQGTLLVPKIEECVKRNINIIGFKISSSPKQSFDKISEIYNDFKMKNGDNGQFIEIYNFERGNQEAVSKNFKKFVMDAAHKVINPSYKYLKRLKEILQLKNDLEKDIDGYKSLTSILAEGTDNYVITDDNYKKMALLFYRIKANVPVIIMGETGCGKTSLIIKLSQILSNGKKLVEIINIHPSITDEEIISNMKIMNEKAKKKEYKENGLWVFFDEINTCLSSSLLIEIINNRTFNGEKLADNIRLIGACNPYRNRKENIERFGLTREDDDDDRLVYKVEKLPESLLYYVFSFGSLHDEDEKKIYKKYYTKIIF